MYNNRYSYVLNNPLKYTDPTGQRYALYSDNKVDNGIPNKKCAKKLEV